ncbi:MAG: HEPN domain-containing protein, partial [Bacteroidota bacterium]
IADLPAEKLAELEIITETLRQAVSPEMIILFGSFARGTWVQDIYEEDGIVYTYRSDYDLLVVTSNQRLYKDWGFQQALDKIRKDPRIGRTVSLIHHSISFLNTKIRDQYYFFVDIYKEGVLLYDSQRFKLSAPKKLSVAKRSYKASEGFARWFGKADAAYRSFELNLQEACCSEGPSAEESTNEAAFNLHQATERYYTASLLVFTDHRPKTHDIAALGRMLERINRRFITIFPTETDEEEKCFKLLQKAYVDARYAKDYRITIEELQYLSGRVQALRTLTETICQAELTQLEEKRKAEEKQAQEEPEKAPPPTQASDH